MTRHVFHANLELFVFAFLRYHAIALERGILCSAYNFNITTSLHKCFCSLLLFFFLQAQFLSSRAREAA